MEYPPITGGGASYSKNLITQLVKLKIKIVLITSGDSDSVEKISDYLTIKRYKVFQDLYYDAGGLLQGVDVLLQQIRDESPDILHTVYIEETLIGQIANLNYGIPHVVTHTKTPMYREESITKNSTWSLFDYVNRNNSVVYVAPGLAYRDSLLQSGVKNSAIHLICPGIDQVRFKKIHNNQLLKLMRNRLSIDPKDSILLIPCMLRKRKGLHFVAEALSKLSIPGHKIKVIITGIPQNQEEILIYQDFKELKGNVEVVEHGRFSDEDMPILYNIADITVLCSEAEGYGTVFLEAMASECPVIGSDVVGINGLITNSYDGILCKYGDCDALNKAITKVLTDSSTKEILIKNALSSLRYKYNLQKQAKNHLKLYKELCNSERQATCVLYRCIGDKEEVYLLNNKSKYFLPRISKQINESWLQAAIREARKISGYYVVIPDHLIFDQTNKNEVSYSFNIKADTRYINLKVGKTNARLWVDLNEAIQIISDGNDRVILRKLKTFLRNDYRARQVIKSI